MLTSTKLRRPKPGPVGSRARSELRVLAEG